MARPSPSAIEAGYERNVFINCPFDDDYRPLFEATVFAVAACGLRPRRALEAADGGVARIDKIVQIIRECGRAIHDISRTELNQAGLPRFNMPFGLGLFMGAQRFGNKTQNLKTCLILDREPHRFQAYLSDIGGQDIAAHAGRPDAVIKAVREWLAPAFQSLPGPEALSARYDAFRVALPAICDEFALRPDEMTFVDLARIVRDWLAAT